jgi:soluble lytic murein transglycosylase
MNATLRFHLSALLLLGLLAVPARADIYSFVDKHGVLHFTNVPTSSKYRLYMREVGLQRTYRAAGSYSYTTPPGGFSSRYDHLIDEASQLYGVSFPLLKAVIKAESNFNPQAVSPKGALGLMQLMPENVRLLSVSDPFDPRENIMGGANFLKRQLNRFDNQMTLALAAYNAGPELVDRYRRIPPISETETYVQRVLDYYRHLSKNPK